MCIDAGDGKLNQNWVPIVQAPMSAHLPIAHHNSTFLKLLRWVQDSMHELLLLPTRGHCSGGRLMKECSECLCSFFAMRSSMLGASKISAKLMEGSSYHLQKRCET